MLAAGSMRASALGGLMKPRQQRASAQACAAEAGAAAARSKSRRSNAVSRDCCSPVQQQQIPSISSLRSPRALASGARRPRVTAAAVAGAPQATGNGVNAQQEQRPLEVCIAGGGIGGLVLAVALLKKGVKVSMMHRLRGWLGLVAVPGPRNCSRSDGRTRAPRATRRQQRRCAMRAGAT